ncbi:hypothetical protein CANCADRAFT_891 [Tortispora caseinolytica NRRL Y-17796]|uniref:Mediator of RNA polymerase II transcription subunit 16 n=1 Tax=Tortispora caseinolytica NRRL Y-17796 TaxID=767744 RepID=A0A1E4TKQ7_9ASCO|nr:hypothetical protein CANCADRAFT_891 [Tortispora caseinolytica NRRL Y-17796]
MSGAISWSKYGFLAYLTNNKHTQEDKIFISMLQPTDGYLWHLSPPFLLIKDLASLVSNKVKLISWSLNSAEIAIVDSHGQVSFIAYSPIPGASRCIYQSSPLQSADPAFSRVVGFEWLLPDRDQSLLHSATRPSSDQKFTYNLHTSVPQCATHSPLFKQVAMALTTSGILRLWYQPDVRPTPNSPYPKFRELSCVIERGVIFSHASFGTIPIPDSTACDPPITLVAAYAPLLREIRLYKVTWKIIQSSENQQPTPKPQQPQQQPNQSMAAPEHIIKSLEVSKLVICNISSLIRSNFEISQFCLLANRWSSFSHEAHISRQTSLIIGLNSTDSTQNSKLLRWNVKFQKHQIHPSFETLRNVPGVMHADQVCTMQLADSFEFPSNISSIHVLPFEPLLIVHFTSGHIEFRDINSLAKLSPTENPSGVELVSTALDVGFQLPSLRPDCLYYPSPNGCGFAFFDQENGELGFSPLILPTVNIAESGVFPVIAAFIAYRHGNSYFRSTSSEDLLHLSQKLLFENSKNFPNLPKYTSFILSESHRALNYVLDGNKDITIEKLMTHTMLQKCLSLQTVLGVRPGWIRPISSRVAHVVLNLRLLAFAISFTLRSIQNQNPRNNVSDSEYKAITIASLLGMVQWFTDLLTFMTREMVQNHNEPELYYKPCLTLGVLMSQTARLFFQFCLRGIRGFEQIISRAARNDGDVKGPVQMTFGMLREITGNAPVSIAAFETFTGAVDSVIKHIYPSLQNQLGFSQAWFFQATVSPVMKKVVERIDATFAQKVLPTVDHEGLYFTSTAWLGLDDLTILPLIPTETELSDKQNEALNIAIAHLESRKGMDEIRKRVMPRNNPQAIPRICSRCGCISVWEIFNSQVPFIWSSAAFPKICPCGGYWLPLKSSS